MYIVLYAELSRDVSARHVGAGRVPTLPQQLRTGPVHGSLLRSRGVEGTNIAASDQLHIMRHTLPPLWSTQSTWFSAV